LTKYIANLTKDEGKTCTRKLNIGQITIYWKKTFRMWFGKTYQTRISMYVMFTTRLFKMRRACLK